MTDHLGSEQEAEEALAELFRDDTPLSTRTSHPTPNTSQPEATDR